MSKIFNRRLSFLLSVAAFAVVGSGLSAQAQTLDTGSTTEPQAGSYTPAPVPGTTGTSAEFLAPQPAAPASETPAPEVAQTNIDLDPGQATRGVSSYIGVAGNLGLTGESALGDSSFTVISKIGLTNTISARPSVMIQDDPVILIPVTYDLSFQPLDPFDEPLPIAPYVGAGVGIETSDDTDVGFLLTGGIDVPLTGQFTATAAVNALFAGDTDVGILIGVGYNFGRLF